MNRVMYLITVLSLSFSIKAQEKYLLKIDKKDSELRIKMPVRNNFYVSKIIDGRTVDTSRIGFIYKRTSNGDEKIDVVFQDGLVSTFKDLIQMGSLDEKLKDIQEPICLMIKDLEVSGAMGNIKNNGRVGVSVVFLKEQSDVLKPIFSIEIFTEAGKGSIQANTVKMKICLEKILLQFENYLNNKSQVSSETELDIELEKEALKLGLTTQSYSPNNSEEVALNISRKYGIYNSFDSFRKNQPDIVKNFLIEPDEDVLKLYSSTKKPLKGNYFCLSDGKNIYVNTYKYNNYRSFVKTYTVGNMILWNNNSASLNNKRQNGYVTGAVVGGLIGGLVASSMTGEYTGCTTLNFKTETYTFVDRAYLEALLKNESELLKLYKTAPNRKDAEVILYYVKEYYKKH